MAKKTNNKNKKTNRKYSRKNKKNYKGGCECQNKYYHNTSGGKKYKNTKKNIKYTKIMHGGNNSQPWFSNDPFGNNYVQYTGSTPGAILGTNMLFTIPNSNNSITESPLLHPERVFNA